MLNFLHKRYFFLIALIKACYFEKSMYFWIFISLMEKITLNVNIVIKADLPTVWEYWHTPEHILNWNHASDDWYCPAAENDFRPNGQFKYTMSSKDNATSFDFEGTYQSITNQRRIDYIISDGRQVKTYFTEDEHGTHISISFEAEDTFALEIQEQGWQAILDSFKAYTEGIQTI